jgi:hypothetical protein
LILHALHNKLCNNAKADIQEQSNNIHKLADYAEAKKFKSALSFTYNELAFEKYIYFLVQQD